MKRKLGLLGIWVVINLITLLTVEGGDYDDFFPIIKSDFNIEQLHQDYDISEFAIYTIFPILLNWLFSKSRKKNITD